MAKKQFKAESKRLLDLMINSIYTHKEIFLRELISNASDAIDKLCYQSLTDDGVGLTRADFRIRVSADKDARTITVSDNGLGMSLDDLERNLGVIAHSGSLRFKNDMAAEGKEKADVEIIGQFGVGFYSAFMVAEEITVISRKYTYEEAHVWTSSGADGYTVSECEKAQVGTDVILRLKPDTEDEKYSDYLQSWKLQELVKKYSDYVRWPIVMDVERYEERETGETDENGKPKKEFVSVSEEKTVNSMVPIWQRAKGDVSEADCKAFYQEKFHDPDEPLAVIRIDAEGSVSYRAMIFIPAKAPYDFYTREFRPGLQLYSSGVKIMEHCPDLVPECFRFVRGLVDSPDLNLNISREILQHDRQLKVIANNLEKKIRAELKKRMEDRPAYEEFWKAFGLQIKYGVVTEFGKYREQLQDLMVFANSYGDALMSLEEYAAKMPESQKMIYYAASDTVRRAADLPQTEQVRAAGFGLLYMTDDVDEFVVQLLGEYQGKPFCNVSSDDLGLQTDMEKAEIEKAAGENRELLEFMQETLGGAVSAVRLSHKLCSHPVCLTTEGEITLEIERYFRELPGDRGKDVRANKILELNGSHPAFAALQKAFAEDKERAAVLTRILLGQAKLIAALPLDNPSGYTEMVCSLF